MKLLSLAAMTIGLMIFSNFINRLIVAAYQSQEWADVIVKLCFCFFVAWTILDDDEATP